MISDSASATHSDGRTRQLRDSRRTDEAVEERAGEAMSQEWTGALPARFRTRARQRAGDASARGTVNASSGR